MAAPQPRPGCCGFLFSDRGLTDEFRNLSEEVVRMLKDERLEKDGRLEFVFEFLVKHVGVDISSSRFELFVLNLNSFVSNIKSRFGDSVVISSVLDEFVNSVLLLRNVFIFKGHLVDVNVNDLVDSLFRTLSFLDLILGSDDLEIEFL